MRYINDLLKILGKKGFEFVIVSIPCVMLLSAAQITMPDFTAQSGSCFAQGQPDFKEITPELIAEPGCPVAIVSAKTDLEVDGFGEANAIRAYITYKNVGTKPVAAVKFRIGYFNAEGKMTNTFHAPDSKMLSVGEAGSQKWRGEKIDPKTTAIKIRILLVKYSDGSIWESEKTKQPEQN